MRNTKQKELIINIINNSTSHLSADGVYNEARKTIPNISLGTVYRILNSLVDNNLAIAIKTVDGITHFDNTINKHSHFICMNCHQIKDVFNKISIPSKVLLNCKIQDYEIIFHGLCERCLKEEI